MSGVFNRLLDLRLLLVAAVVVTVSSSCAHAADKEVSRESSAAVSARVVELVNAARSNGRKCGSERFGVAPSLSVSQKLNIAAAGHARDMARKKFFEHRGS